jgi:LacI family transcriptional regulator
VPQVRKTTLADVAKAAGVSITTVDRVVNGRGGVDPEKERKILAWARKLRLDRALDRRPTRLLRFGVIIQRPSNPFYESLRAAFGRANELYAASSIQCAIRYFDVLAPGKTASLIREVAATHDALVLACPAHPDIVAAVAAVVAEKPVITLASDLPCSGRTAYVGLDNRAAGRIAGELMGRFVGPAGGDIVIMTGLHSFIGQEEREMGFRAVLRERHPSCRLAAVLEGKERTDRPGDLIREVLRTNPRMVGIYNTSAGNRAIAGALRQLGVAERVVFITHELTPERRQLLQDGVLDVVIDQNPELEVMTAVGTLAQLFGRRETLPGPAITPANIFIRESV